MKKSKLLISLFLVVAMVLAFTACKSSTTESTQASTQNQTTVSSNADTTGAATTEATVSEETKPAAGTSGCKLPDVELKNKVISVFNISDNLDGWRSKTEYPGVIELMEKEYGVKFNVVSFADWSKQYEKLTALYMSNDMPDLLPQANFPTDLANNFIQPLDNLIDFSDPMWDNVRSLMDMIKWKGKTYYAARSPLGGNDWFFFNPQLFEANNLKSPLNYYKEGNWDWNAVLELAKQLTQDLDGDGQIDQWGLGWATGMDSLHSQTGVPLVVINPDGTIKQNLRDPKIAEAANYFRSLGPSQYNVLLTFGGEITQDYVTQQFGEGKVGMYVGGWWRGGLPALIGNWKKGTVDIVPMPRWPGEKTNYLNGQIQSMGVSSKAKNPEGAALFIQVDKYTSTDAYREKYMPNVDPKVNVDLRDNWGMNDRQLETVYEIWHMQAPPVPTLHWIFWDWNDGFLPALSNPWSQVVEELEPYAQAGIDKWVEKLNQIN